ncbi:MAG TPA: TolC family protein [Bryobacteraceae bacterium]|jgi:outer membrane protein TolC|nr:TolC family protein [Bryobacteraceae bacterium]
MARSERIFRAWALASLALVLAGRLPAQVSRAAYEPSGGTLRLSLRDALDLAMKQNPHVQMANLQVLRAQAAADVARSALLPQLSLDINSGYQTLNLRALGFALPGVPDRVGPFQQFDVRPVFTQTLYSQSQRKELAASRERASESRWNAVSVREAMLLSVAQLYLEALDQNARIDAAGARIRSARALLKQTRQFVEAGTASRLDESRAEMQVANETRTMTELQGLFEIRKLMLANLLGIPASTRLDLTETFIPPQQGTVLVDAAITKALQNRPEMKAVQARLRAASADRQKAAAERYPTAAFSMDFGRMGNSMWNNVSTYALRGSVRLPILQGGRIEAQVRSAEAEIREVEEEVRKTRLQIEMEVQTAAVKLNTAEQAYRSAATAATLSRKVLSLAAARFEGGLSSNIEVVNAQEAVASAESVAIRCIFDYYMARAELARVEGNVQDLFE